MIIAIHQPNYFPWLGYFHKIMLADAFVFLDDVQYSKNSYINRVKILGREKAQWMTVPIAYDFGDPINAIHPAAPGWIRSHMDRLRTAYDRAGAFAETWDWIQSVMEEVSEGAELASVNRYLAEAVTDHLGLDCQFMAASDLDIGGLKGDDRLVALVKAIDTHATYLSGGGGGKYQDEAKFEVAGIELKYANFRQQEYHQGPNKFIAGLSTLDALFHLGRESTVALLSEGIGTND